jgi:hypothetical protein
MKNPMTYSDSALDVAQECQRVPVQTGATLVLAFADEHAIDLARSIVALVTEAKIADTQRGKTTETIITLTRELREARAEYKKRLDILNEGSAFNEVLRQRDENAAKVCALEAELVEWRVAGGRLHHGAVCASLNSGGRQRCDCSLVLVRALLDRAHPPAEAAVPPPQEKP